MFQWFEMGEKNNNKAKQFSRNSTVKAQPSYLKPLEQPVYSEITKPRPFMAFNEDTASTGEHQNKLANHTTAIIL